MQTSPPCKFKPGAGASVRGEGRTASQGPGPGAGRAGMGAPGSGAGAPWARGWERPRDSIVREAEMLVAIQVPRRRGRGPAEGGARPCTRRVAAVGTGWGVRPAFRVAPPAVQRPPPLTLGARLEHWPRGDHCRSGLRAGCLEALVHLYTPKRGGGAEASASPGMMESGRHPRGLPGGGGLP